MTSEKIPEAVVAVTTTVFGMDPSDTLSPMAGGASGALLFTVRANGEMFVVRTPGTVGGPLDPDTVQRHLECMRIAARLGVAPELVHADPQTGITIMRKIDGVPLTRGSPRETDPLGKLATTLRTLHRGPAMPGDPLPYELFLAMIEHPLPAELVPTIEAAVAELAPMPQVASHRDLNPTNLLLTADRLYLIDWETAGPADPLFDIALATVWMCRPSEHVPLMTAYLEHAPDVSELRRFAVNRVLALGFYGLVFHALSKDPPIVQGASLDQLFARMASGGAMFTLPEMGSALVSAALTEAKAGGLLS